MLNSFMSTLLKPTKKDVLFQSAIGAANSLKTLISLSNESSEGIDIDSEIFHRVFPNDKKSPAIYWIDKNQYLIFYPIGSTPYDHSFDDKCKFVEVLSGALFDKKSDQKLFKGDKLKIYPSHNYIPYTIAQPCYLRVCVGSCDLSFEEACY